MTDCISPPHSTLSLLKVTQQHINFSKVINSSAVTCWKNKNSDEERLILVVFISASNIYLKKKYPQTITQAFKSDCILYRWTAQGLASL